MTEREHELRVDTAPDEDAADSADSADSTGAFERIVAGLSDRAGVETVYGDPVEAGDRTILPVARVAYGFGGGSGEGEEGTGFGGGGGVFAAPVGALEVDGDGTRFVRFGERREVLGAAVVAFLVGVFLGRRGRRGRD